METCIAYCETSKFAGVLVIVSAALNCSGNETWFLKLVVEEASVAAQVAYQIADLGSNAGVTILNKHTQLGVEWGLMNEVVEVLWKTSKLRDQTQSVDDEIGVVFRIQEVVLLDDTESSGVDELLGEVAISVRVEHETA